MDIAIVGAAGDCGRQIASRIATERLLLPTDRLQLVGKDGAASTARLIGLATDIKDASAETAPQFDVALSPHEVVADIIVFAAGVQADRDGGHNLRDASARANLPLFREYARAIAAHSLGHEIVLVVTNPVELGVAIFARELGRHRVIGIGAHSDTLRFRREIAKDIGVRRQFVRGFALGEHGDAVVPAWSTVSVYGMEPGELQERLPLVRRGRDGAAFAAALHSERQAMMDLIGAGSIVAAFERINNLETDLRTALKPYVTLLSGAKTSFATAGVVVDLLHTLLDGRETVVAGQVLLQGEFPGLSGVLGVPITVGGNSGIRVLDLPLSTCDEARLRDASRSINSKIAGWLADE